jgi:hypothetical protein
MNELAFLRRGTRIVPALKQAIAVARGKASPAIVATRPVRQAAPRTRRRKRRW